MPQNPCVIATKTPTSDVLIFDYTKHPSKPGMFLSEHSPQFAAPFHLSTFMLVQKLRACNLLLLVLSERFAISFTFKNYVIKVCWLYYKLKLTTIKNMAVG